MKLQRYSQKLKNHRLVYIRRVVGRSMIPAIKPGDIIVALPMLKIRQGDIVLASQNGREVIKRVARLSSDSVFLVGDNLNESSDGRKYGETKLADVIGRVLLR